MLAATPRALGLDVPTLARYYAAVADWMLPHVVDRPLGLLRSLDEQGLPFFQRHSDERRLIVRDREELLALATIETIEIHVWGSKLPELERPDRLVFDLEPGEDLSWTELIEAAFLVKEGLQEHGLASFALLTGSRGIHVLCPLTPQADWPHALDFAKDRVERLAARYPSRFVTSHAMTDRAGRILIDPTRNERGATSIAPYSTRARKDGAVAAPLAWEELEVATGPAIWTIETMPARLAGLDREPWADFSKTRQTV